MSWVVVSFDPSVNGSSCTVVIRWWTIDADEHELSECAHLKRTRPVCFDPFHCRKPSLNTSSCQWKDQNGNWSPRAGFCRKVDHALCLCRAVIRVTATLTAGHSFLWATIGSQSLSAWISEKWSRSNCTSLLPNVTRPSCVFSHSRGSDSRAQAASMGSSWT